MSNALQSKEKLWTFPYLFLLGISILTATSFNMVQPVLPLYTESLGYSLGLAGMLSGTIAVTALIFRPISGYLSDRFSKRKLLILAQIVIGVALLGLSFSTYVYELFTFRILQGIAFAISSTVNVALVSLMIPKSRMGEGISYFGLSQIIALSVGPNLSIWMSEHWGYGAIFQTAAILMAIAALPLLLWKNTRADSKAQMPPKPGLSSLFAKEVLSISVVGGCFSFANGVIVAFLVMYGQARGIEHVGLYFVVNACTLLAVRILLGKLSDKLSLERVMYPALGMALIAVLLLCFGHSLVFVLLAAVLYAIGQGVGQPALQAEAVKRVSVERRGTAMSTYFIGADVGQGVGPTVGGKVSEQLGYGTMFGMCGIIIVAGAGVFHFFRKKERAVHNK